MFKRIIAILLVVILGVSIWLTYNFLQKESDKLQHPISAIPIESGIIIECNNLSNIWTYLSETNLVYSAALNVESVQRFDRSLKAVDSLLSSSPQLSTLLDRKPVCIGLYQQEELQYFAVTQCNTEQFTELHKVLSTLGSIVDKKDENGNAYFHFTKGNTEFHFANYAPFLMLSSHGGSIPKSIAQVQSGVSLLENEEFEQVRSKRGKTAMAHIYLQANQLGGILNPFVSKSFVESVYAKQVFPNWMELDLSGKSNSISLNGLSGLGVENFVFTNSVSQEPLPSLVRALLPEKLVNFKRTSISNPAHFIDNNSKANIEELSSRCDCNPQLEFQAWMGSELTSFEFGNSNHPTYLVGVTLPDVHDNLIEFGIADSVSAEYLETDMYLVENWDALKMLGLYAKENDIYYFAQLDGYAAFATETDLKRLIKEHYNNRETIPITDYGTFSDNLMANYSNVDYYWSMESLLDNIVAYIKPEFEADLVDIKSHLGDLNAIGYQSSKAKNDMLYHSISINTKLGNKKAGAITNLWNLKLQKPIVGVAQLMQNHRTKTLEVVVQDIDNQLHLISATGKIKWSKNINEPIIGEITQIDIYGNGKFQMLFNTASKIHLVDINGNEVSGYPISLKENAINQVAAIDYESNHNYRLLVATINKNILNFSKEGMIVEGWSALPSGSLITNPFQHFVVDGKDFIFNTDISGSIYLLNRKGEIRYTVDSTINSLQKDKVKFKKGNSIETCRVIYLDTANHFASLSFDNEFKAIELDSTLVDFNYYITDLDFDKLNEYIILEPNKLSVYGPDKSIIYSEIFDFNILQNVSSIGDKNKQTVVYHEAMEEIYLYNHQFEALQGFPLKGGRNTLFGDINKDGNNEVITITIDNEIIVYSLNPFFGL